MSRRPSRLIDITRLPLNKVEETAGRRPAHRRAGAQLRPRLSPADRAALSAAVERDPGRRLAAAAQHGLDRRQPPAAHALLLLLRHRDALQQARARQRLLGDRRPQPHARDPRHQRGLHRDASLRHVRRARGARGEGPCRRAGRRRAASRSRTSIGCPATRRSATPTCEPDEIITAVELPAQGLCGELQLPEDPRPAVLRVRAGVGRGGARARGRHASRRRASRSAASRTSRGAIRRPKRRCAGKPANAADLRAGGRRAAARRQGLRRTTPSRSTSRAAPSCAR